MKREFPITNRGRSSKEWKQIRDSLNALNKATRKTDLRKGQAAAQVSIHPSQAVASKLLEAMQQPS